MTTGMVVAGAQRLRCAFSGGTPFCIRSGPLSQRKQVDQAESCDCGHEMGIPCKKGLDFARNKPRLRIPPRPVSGSSGPPVAGSPSTPISGGPPLSFWPILPLRFARGGGVIHRQQSLGAKPVLQQVGPLILGRWRNPAPAPPNKPPGQPTNMRKTVSRKSLHCHSQGLYGQGGETGHCCQSQIAVCPEQGFAACAANSSASSKP